MINPPQFWWGSLPLYWKLLGFLEWIYIRVSKIRWRWVTPQRVSVPVVCVGNLTLGGTGKTPVALSLGGYFLKKGKKVGFLSRGYGGKLKGPARVRSHHTAQEVGDESLLLARLAPTWISVDRVAGAEAMIKEGINLIIMDDGYQNPSLYKDVSLVVVDGIQGFGNKHIFPLGPLREPITEGLKRADGVVMVRPSSAELKKDLAHYKGSLFQSTIELDQKKIPEKVVAFCGIGNPDKFFRSLKECGIEIVVCEAFPDHYEYTTSDIQKLKQKASHHQASLVTTEKDWVRLSVKDQKGILAVPMVLKWEQWLPMEKLLEKKITR